MRLHMISATLIALTLNGCSDRKDEASSAEVASQETCRPLPQRRLPRAATTEELGRASDCMTPSATARAARSAAPATVTQARCAELRDLVDRLPSKADVASYLRTEVENQRELRDLFLCSAKAKETMPTAYAPSGRSYIRGSGFGSISADNDIEFWNELQARIGRLVWGGKVFEAKSNGEVRLLNIMTVDTSMSFEAKVHHMKSILDGKSSIVLDYRDDATSGLLSSQAVRRVRDEMREIVWRGQPTRVYLGRAYLFTGKLGKRHTGEWLERENFDFAANFFLDFNVRHQEDIPSWQVPGAR